VQPRFDSIQLRQHAAKSRLALAAPTHGLRCSSTQPSRSALQLAGVPLERGRQLVSGLQL
jgi:hypothetical protein